MADAMGQGYGGYQTFRGGAIGTSAVSTTYTANFLMRFPWSYQIIENISRLNPKYQIFHQLAQATEEKASRQSIFSAYPKTGTEEPAAAGMLQINKDYHEFMYANIEDADKVRRLNEYRRMASFAEVADCIDEICDELVVKDIDGDIIKCHLNGEYDTTVKNEIKKEWKIFINRFNLSDRCWEYFRCLLTDGELYFENIISQKKPDLGVIGVAQIPCELINPIYDNISNMKVRGYILKKPVLDIKSQVTQRWQEEIIPLEKKQITYIHSGIWNENRTIKLPYIENCRRAYKQLSLIEDSIVIYRLVRAPERLAFYVDVGNMTPPKAENYLKRLMQQFWSRKNYDASQGRMSNIYDPQSMLDSFWFAKRNGSDGTKVEVLKGGENLGKLEDLDYFVKKLYKSLKVPESRLMSESTASVDESTITREELRFARFCIRIQQQFATGLKNGFITHLKLRNLWDKYKVKDVDLNVIFNLPTNFLVMREQQILSLKFSNFNNITQNGAISHLYAQRHYLGMSDKQMAENIAFLKKYAGLRWELSQIETQGPNFREKLKAAEAAMKAGGGAAQPPEAGGMPSPGGAVTPESLAAMGVIKSPEEAPPEFGGEGGGTPAPASGGGGGSALPGAPGVK